MWDIWNISRKQSPSIGTTSESEVYKKFVKLKRKSKKNSGRLLIQANISWLTIWLLELDELKEWMWNYLVYVSIKRIMEPNSGRFEPIHI